MENSVSNTFSGVYIYYIHDWRDSSDLDCASRDGLTMAIDQFSLPSPKLIPSPVLKPSPLRTKLFAVFGSFLLSLLGTKLGP